MSSEKSFDSAVGNPRGGATAEHPEAGTTEATVSIALDHFAREGFEGAKLEAIARDSGMSKRMIHYHFGDKKGLYQQAVITAMGRLHVPEEAFQVDSAVPVEGIRSLVDAIFRQFILHPDSLRLVVAENLQNILRMDEIPPLIDESGLKLRLDRLLLTGQDAGAFRPGISADDLIALISALPFYRLSSGMQTRNLFGIDFGAEENIAGMHRMTVDTVLAFLTSNIPDSGQSSYLTPMESTTQAQTSMSIYADEDF
ncbi:MAG TPA: TetR/AcrR family transcriptional regulator [Corynebacterium sp.]|nr:TetR/AcrR family transcriptional regulator [Corynebacterium sp.]